MRDEQFCLLFLASIMRQYVIRSCVDEKNLRKRIQRLINYRARDIDNVMKLDVFKAVPYTRLVGAFCRN